MQRSITWRGTVAGALGGFIGSWVMDEFQVVWSAAERRISKNGNQNSDEQAKSANQEPAPVKIVAAAEHMVLNREPSESHKKIGSQVVHYGFGTAMGLLYGALADKTSKVRAGGGTLFATSLWLGADEIAVPALKLSPPPTDTPKSKHLYGLASHLIYGLTLEGVRRAVLVVTK
jgi:predicted cobalt transporter CbtA